MATITRYEPSRQMVPLSEAINQLFSDSFAFPRLLGREFGAAAGSNLYETKDSFVLQVALPGVAAEAVDITVQKEVLTLKAKGELKAPEGARAVWTSLGTTEVAQSFTLPAAIDSEAAHAAFADGILTLTLPKAEYVKARTIKVNGATSNGHAE
jgi:HSP20 family protein